MGGDGIRDFNSEFFIYLGDQANMPYGNYSQENNVPLLKEHIIKDVLFLLSNKYYKNSDDENYRSDKKSVKAIVIACNTATAYGKEDIENFMERADLDLKVIGVIDAGVRAALAVMDKSENGSIGVMATAGTVASKGYVKTILSQREKLGYTGNIKIFQQAGIGLAGAIDGASEFITKNAIKPRDNYKGPSEKHKSIPINTSILKRYGFDWSNNKMLFKGNIKNKRNIQINSVENYISYHIVSLLEQVRNTKGSSPLKVIILGCTHYPFYEEVFEQKLRDLYNYKEDGKYIYRKYMAEKILLVDPAQNTARELYAYLDKTKLFNSAQINESEFYISVPNKMNKNVQLDSLGNFTYEYKYSREAGYMQEYVKRIPLSESIIPRDYLNRLEKKIPETLDLIRGFNQTN